MAHKVIDRCKETTSTTGTGTLTLTGPAAGHVSVASALTVDGDTSWFVAENGTEWEMFLGTRVDSTHLARTTFIKSSTGSSVNFTASPVVFSAVPGEKLSTVGPAFRAYLSADQTGVVSATYTKVALNTESFDTDGCFDSTTNYRFTPAVPGIYRFEWVVDGQGASLTTIAGQLYKNGAVASPSVYAPLSSTIQVTVGSCLLYMNGTTDYVELYGYLTGTTLKFRSSSANTSLSGSFVRPG